jgi:isochorismate synthase
MDSFFETLLNQFDNKLPFVCYRKPNEIIVKSILQSDSKIHHVNDYSESGFVFAPFDNQNKSILIPFENYSEFIFENLQSLSLTSDIYDNFDNKRNHIELVEKGINAINSSSLSKIVLSRKEQYNATENPITLFKNALSLYKNAFVYLWYHPKVGCWLGATPEVLLQTRNNQFKTMSLAGTKMFEDKLQWENKEKEEQKIVTDYIVNNLKDNKYKFTTGIPYTLKAGGLAHIRTDINGVLNSSLKTLIDILHPTPAVCGFPKEEAKQFIIENEDYDREYYTGFLGELNISSRRKNNKRNTENLAYRFTTKSSNLYVNLRCMKINKKDISIYVGGGITKNSNPLSEYTETCNKLNTMKRLL